MKKLLASLVILASVTSLSGCMKNFDKLQMNTTTSSFVSELKNIVKEGDGIDANLQLARIYFEHNYLAQADAILTKIVAQEPESMEALAWYGANNCKIAGADFPWAMGMRKLANIETCLTQIKTALDQEPENFTIQLIAINTGSVVNMKGSLVWATDTRKKMTETIKENPEYFPTDVLNYYNYASAENEIAHGKLAAGKALLNKVITDVKDNVLVVQASLRIKELSDS